MSGVLSFLSMPTPYYQASYPVLLPFRAAKNRGGFKGNKFSLRNEAARKDTLHQQI